MLRTSLRLVLVAPPGAGKTTRVPLALLDEPWLAGGKLVLLEPRRLAARAAARRLAASLGERVGETVGYRMRNDTVVGRATRLEVVTEGVLTRMLQHDPALSGVGCVLFDEFHERSLHADLGLALTLYSQHAARDDLRIVVMSATLDGDAVARALGAPALVSEGRAFPVVTHHRPPRERERLAEHVARIARDALAADDGDALVFLPGAAEIARVTERLRSELDDPRVDVHPLFGDLAGEAQDAAIAPAPRGRRKVVVATNIAETSLTIEGVRIVVDSGLARAPRFSPRTGMSRLETIRVSRASADQRRGRAGRTAPGVCYRLWPEHDDLQLAPRTVPEILEADLAGLALELAVAGFVNPADLTWLDQPPAGALAQARSLLQQLGALDAAFRVTSHGRALAELPAHPRIAHLLVEGDARGHAALACDLAAILGERDILRPAQPGVRVDADLRHRVALLAGEPHSGSEHLDRDTLRRVRIEARRWRDRLGAGSGSADHNASGALLALAYPDRIARLRPGAIGRYLLANGTGAHFKPPHPLGSEEWLVIAETDGRTPESTIFLAAPTALAELTRLGAATIRTSELVEWDTRTERVVALSRDTIGAIVVSERPLRDAPTGAVTDALLAEVRRRGLGALPWSEGARRLRERIAFLHARDGGWPDVSDAALLATLETWLAPVAADARSPADLARADLTSGVRQLLDWKQRAELDRLAPTHIEVPSGSRIAVDYSNPDAPQIAVRLQELYGLAVSPTVAAGQVPLTLQLLSPAHRPVQVTRDLAAFWRGSYAEVRKEMRGRYPKHDWPEDPVAATPSRGRPRR